MPQSGNKSRWFQAKLLIFGAVLGATAVLLYFAIRNINSQGDPELVAFSEFYSNVEDGSIRSVRITGATARGYLEGGGQVRTRLPEDHGEFISQLAEEGVTVEVVTSDLPRWQQFVVNTAPFFGLLGFWIWIMVATRRARKAASQESTGREGGNSTDDG